VSYRSWLKDVTHINDIDPFAATLKYDHDDHEKMDDARTNKLIEYFRRPIPSAVQNQQFFNGRMHDAQFISLQYDRKTAKVTLNDLDAETLVNDTNNVLGLNHPKIVIPVDLVFHDVRFCNTLRPDLKDSLRYDNIASALPETADFHLNFIGDWFWETEQRVQWVGNVYAQNGPSHKLDSNIYILIDCATATAIDRRLPALKNIYGPNIVPLWNDYLNRVDFPESPSYYPQYVGGFYDYFERRLPAHGLTWEDLRPKNLNP